MKETKIFLVLAIIFVTLFSLLAVRRAVIQLRPHDDYAEQVGAANSIDCGMESACRELVIRGDSKYMLPNDESSPFSGYADPSIRKDSNGVLWMAYSWPHLKFVDNMPVPSVDIHLAESLDKGNNWDFVDELFIATPATNPVDPSQQGYIDYEVVNLLPVEINGETIWFGVTLNYFVPEQGGMSARPSNSFHIRVYQVRNLIDISSASYAILGGGVTAEEWNVNQSLIPDNVGKSERNSFFWNEPSLYYENGTLYLAMVSFHLANRSDISRDSVHVFATRPEGVPSSWRWEYKGELAGRDEAALLQSKRLTQVDIVRGEQGNLLLIASPDDWDNESDDYNHKGCVALEIASLDNPSLKKHSSGNLVIHAAVKDSKANKLGSAACSYDPSSNTGILFTRRNKTKDELTASLWQTYLKP